jgi:predicted amidophosphoribosyltransferase
MKKIIGLTTKDSSDNNYACGECFAILELEDKYCWNCGAEFGDEPEIVYYKEDLIKEEKK